jgi:hypothetical protein
VLAHLLQTKAVDPKPPATDVRDREQSSRLSALSNFSIGDVFRDVAGGGSKSTKFPEKLLKVLEQKLQDVALGKDPMSVFLSISPHCLLFTTGILTNSFAERWESFTVNLWWTASNAK